jgi:hypothetical protein
MPVIQLDQGSGTWHSLCKRSRHCTGRIQLKSTRS